MTGFRENATRASTADDTKRVRVTTRVNGEALGDRIQAGEPVCHLERQIFTLL
jgi:hypothetical protein